MALSLSHRCRHCNHQLQQSSTITIIIINNTINNCKNHCRLCPCWPRSSSLGRRSSSSSSTPETAPACVSHCKLVSLLATSQGHEQRTRKTSPGFACGPSSKSECWPNSTSAKLLFQVKCPSGLSGVGTCFKQTLNSDHANTWVTIQFHMS